MIKKSILLMSLISFGILSAGQTQASESDVATAMAPNGPVILAFKAKWCGACKQAEPALKRLQKKYSGRVSVISIDVDDPANENRGEAIPGSAGILPASENYASWFY